MSERFVPGSVEGSCIGPQGDELYAELHMEEHVPSRSRRGALLVLASPLGQQDLATRSGLSWSLWVCPSSCRMLSCSSTSMAECWGLPAGDQ